MAEEIHHTRPEEDIPPTPAFHRGIQALFQCITHYRQYSHPLTLAIPHNRASSSFTPPPEHRPTVHPNPAVPSTLVSKRKEVSFSAMTHVPAVYPVTDALPPSPAPMAVPFCNFSIGRLRCVRSAASSYANTYLSQKFLDQYRFCAETPLTLLDLSMMEMRESQTFEAYATEWKGKAVKHFLPITERQQVQLFYSTLRGAHYSHLLVHTSSFSDLIEAGKKLDMGVKLGRIDDLSRKKDGKASKK
ncbi:hypothetical protein CRG98_037600 [Punica granatum]|uniref:Retrotransposon gag domain-containing protein n=1 Tax=Punica granatum TaxID=22663 RepID=A0A2I0IDA9_PUNGR|nr:hypothetical protein CRG98_037600 [Punica granatum]